MDSMSNMLAAYCFKHYGKVDLTTLQQSMDRILNEIYHKCTHNGVDLTDDMSNTGEDS